LRATPGYAGVELSPLSWAEKGKEPCYVNHALTNQKDSVPGLAAVEVERASADAQDSDQVGPLVIGTHLSQANRKNKQFRM